MRSARALLAVGMMAAAGPVAIGAVRPSLRVVELSPLSVHGYGFGPVERVTVTVSLARSHKRLTTANASGSFTLQFPDLTIEPCAAYAVAATGNEGSKAVYKPPPAMCGTKPAPVTEERPPRSR